MKKYLPILKQSPLFTGMETEELEGLLRCLNPRTANYRKQEILLLEGQPVSSMGIVLAGSVQIIREDFAGNRTILTEISPGNLFAEAFACVQVSHLPVTVISAMDTKVLWVDYYRVVSSCPSACLYHTRLIENMLFVLASKNILLQQKIEHLSRHTIREKVLSYLSGQSAALETNEFDVPFNRQELADYLCVDRSALSAELSRMQRDDILRFRRSHFILLRAGRT